MAMLPAGEVFRESARQESGVTLPGGKSRERPTVACALDKFASAQGQKRKEKNQPQEAAGEAIGAASLAAGLAISVAAGLEVSAGLTSGEATTGLASAEASGAGVSSDLVQAVAAKTIEKRARIRNFRIIISFIHSYGAGQALSV
jgi:hypothetical protein